MFKQRKPPKQGDLYFIWHMPTDRPLTTIWELLLEALCKNEIKTGNDAIKSPTEMELFFFLSREQTYRHCLKSSLSSPSATGFILDLKELTAEMRQQLKYSHTQAQNFSAPKSEIGHDHLSICSFFSSNSILLHRSFPAFCCPPTSPHNLELAW